MDREGRKGDKDKESIDLNREKYLEKVHNDKCIQRYRHTERCRVKRMTYKHR